MALKTVETVIIDPTAPTLPLAMLQQPISTSRERIPVSRLFTSAGLDPAQHTEHTTASAHSSRYALNWMYAHKHRAAIDPCKMRVLSSLEQLLVCYHQLTCLCTRYHKTHNVCVTMYTLLHAAHITAFIYLFGCESMAEKPETFLSDPKANGVCIQRSELWCKDAPLKKKPKHSLKQHQGRVAFVGFIGVVLEASALTHDLQISVEKNNDPTERDVWQHSHNERRSQNVRHYHTRLSSVITLYEQMLSRLRDHTAFNIAKHLPGYNKHEDEFTSKRKDETSLERDMRVRFAESLSPTEHDCLDPGTEYIHAMYTEVINARATHDRLKER
eukprot:13794-Heterococcus_DN1.PRE.1